MGRESRFVRATVLVACVALAAVVNVSVAASAPIIFSPGPGLGPAPSTLGPYSMSAFTPSGTATRELAEVSGPIGPVMFAPAMTFLNYPFAGGAAGFLQTAQQTVTVTLPHGTGAFYLYAGWGCTECGGVPSNPGPVTITAVAQDGTSSGAVAVEKFTTPEYFGFYAECASSVNTVTLTVANASFKLPFVIGAFGSAPASSNSHCPTAGSPIPETATAETPQQEQEAFEEIEGCGPTSTPENNLVTPTPPSTLEAELATVHRARDASRFPEPSKPNPYCWYKQKYTEGEKALAKEWYLYYSSRSGELTQAAGFYTFGAAGALAVPDPTISKILAGTFGVGAAVLTYGAGYDTTAAAVMAQVERDPIDPRWRTTAVKTRTYPRRLPKYPGLRHSQQAAIDVYLTALVNGTADSECEVEAINRASTALAHKDTAIAALQYRAGSACAEANVRVAKSLPRLARQATPAVTTLERALTGAAVKKYLAEHLAAYERNPALRARAARRTVAALGRVIALPPSVLVQLQGAFAKRASVRVLTPRRILRAGVAPSKLDAAWRTLQEQAAQGLAAAAAR